MLKHVSACYLLPCLRLSMSFLLNQTRQCYTSKIADAKEGETECRPAFPLSPILPASDPKRGRGGTDSRHREGGTEGGGGLPNDSSMIHPSIPPEEREPTRRSRPRPRAGDPWRGRLPRRERQATQARLRSRPATILAGFCNALFAKNVARSLPLRQSGVQNGGRAKEASYALPHHALYALGQIWTR